MSFLFNDALSEWDQIAMQALIVLLRNEDLRNHNDAALVKRAWDIADQFVNDRAERLREKH